MTTDGEALGTEECSLKDRKVIYNGNTRNRNMNSRGHIFCVCSVPGIIFSILHLSTHLMGITVL